MELELKHWLAYSGIKTYVYGSSDYFVLRSAVQYDDEIELYLYHNIYGNCTGSALEYSLVLYPLSYLDQEITHELETFIPVERVMDELGTEICDAHYEWIQALLDDHERWNDHIMKCNYDMMEYFIKWRIDIFGLINSGLAIDINTSKL